MAAKWDFIRQFNAFADLSIGDLDVNAFAVYVRLFAANNKAGRVEWFSMTNERLMAETGINEKPIIRAKNELIQKGFIEYRKGKKGSPSKYKLTVLYDENSLIDCQNLPVKNNLSNITCNIDREYGSKNGSINGSINGSENGSENGRHIKVKESKAKESKDSSIDENRVEEKIDDLTNSEDFSKVVAVFEQCVHPIKNELEKDELIDLINTYGTDKVIAVIEHADKTQRSKNDRVQSIKYLETILKRWENSGFKELGGKTNERKHGGQLDTDKRNSENNRTDWDTIMRKKSRFGDGD